MPRLLAWLKALWPLRLIFKPKRRIIIPGEDPPPDKKRKIEKP